MSTAPTVELPPALELEELGSTAPLARGATASVEEVGGCDDARLVLKRFFTPQLVNGETLRRLVHWRRELSELERRQLDHLATWPLTTVEEEGQVLGFVMHRVPVEFSQTVRVPSGARRTVLREAQYLLSEERARRLGVTFPAATRRVEIVFALIEAIHFLHRRRIVVGDLSARNILWDAPSARVLMVDCDSMFLGGVGSPLPPAFTVDWDDSAGHADAAASSDVYKLGLFVLRVLTGSFQSRNPEAAAAHIDGTGLLLLRASLSPYSSERPGIEAWERWAAGRRAALRTQRTGPTINT